MTTPVDLSSSSVPGISTGLRGYLGRPEGDGPWPAVVVIFEAFGADDVNQRHVDHLASLGYLALMPDLYTEGGTRRCLVSTMRSLSTGKGRAYQDIEATRQWLLASSDCTGKVGTVGFCMGGGFALMTANRGFDASAVNYGQLPPDPSALDGACPIVGSYGGRDRVNRGAPEKLDAALTARGIAHDIKEYPEAGHSFLNDALNGPRWLRPIAQRVMGVGPRPEESADAWIRIDTFLRTHLA